MESTNVDTLMQT